MKELFSLGEIWVSDFIRDGEEPRAGKHELKLVMDESCGAARLATTIPVNKMFGKYWYRSGTNESMRDALKDVVDSILPYIKKGSKFLDIACNDGTLLSFVPSGTECYGVDPCEFNILKGATKYAAFVEQKFFDKNVFPNKKFDIITAVAMFYDLEFPDKFCQDVHEAMNDDGLFVIQQSYTPAMIKQLAFDNILSEHVYYHTLKSMMVVLERNGFEIVDCTLNDTNGCSFRLFIKKKNRWFASKTHRDVCNIRIESLIYYEDGISWDGFYEGVMNRKEEVVRFIKKAKEEGKTVMAYGASTKGNTLLQVFGLDNTMISGIADRQPKKWGLKTAGTNIPIISEEEFRKVQPDYLLVLPWHFRSEFIERESNYLSNGGTMIFPLPKLEFVSR